MDAFIGKDGTSAEAWLNDGSGNFADSKQRLGNMFCDMSQLIDIDCDGDLDAFTDNITGACKLWINQGGKQNGQAGTFVDYGLTLPSGRGILCDFNNDGKLDAIIGNKIWINEYGPFMLQLSTNFVNIDASAGSKTTFNIISNTNWTITCSETWLTINKTSGINNDTIILKDTIILTTEANPSTSQRTATITISGSGVVSQTVT